MKYGTFFGNDNAEKIDVRSAWARWICISMNYKIHIEIRIIFAFHLKITQNVMLLKQIVIALFSLSGSIYFDRGKLMKFSNVRYRWAAEWIFRQKLLANNFR